jgi:N4-gp56 family major capsid protein
MATTTQTYAGISQEQKTFYDRSLLKRLLPNLVWAQYGQKKGAPKREGDTINFRRFNSLAAATTALTEGVTPDGNILSISAVSAVVKQYGDYVVLSDKIDVTAIDPVVTETTTLLGEQAGLTIDTVVRDILVAGTNVQFAGGKASRDLVAATDVITADEIKKAVRTMRRNKVKPVANGKYIGIISADLEYDLMSDSLWVDVSKYSDKEQIYNGEVGSLYGVKFVRSDNHKKFTGAGASSIDVHCAIILGADAFGMVDIGGQSKPQTIVKPLGSAGVADPLNQRSSVGWKCMFTAKILQELAILRLECAASA